MAGKATRACTSSSGLVRKTAVTTASDRELRDQLHAAADSVGLFLGDLEVVVRKPEPAETDHGEKGEPDEAVIRPRPEDAREDDRADDQHAAHGRRALSCRHAIRPADALRPRCESAGRL